MRYFVLDKGKKCRANWNIIRFKTFLEMHPAVKDLKMRPFKPKKCSPTFQCNIKYTRESDGEMKVDIKYHGYGSDFYIKADPEKLNRLRSSISKYH